MKEAVGTLKNILRRIDFKNLPISDYNKRYIRNLQPALSYYIDIYAHCLIKGLSYRGIEPSEIVCIDYGGGSGFLSMLAKLAGIGQVIYIDINPLSVEAISVLKKETGIGPDVILQGNSDELAEWCAKTMTKPQLLIATDLIEHVYDLNIFFADLLNINREMYLLFTTASNPYNPVKSRQLRSYMQGCESGSLMTPNYSAMRLQFIKERYPEMSDEQTLRWSQQTRGLVYQDIQNAIEDDKLPSPADAYNTCNPETGNWAERILSIQSYEELGLPYNYMLTTDKGFYNTQRGSRLKTMICKVLNILIKNTGKAGFYLSPFIVLSYSPKSIRKRK